jgi:homoserine/homoserine lactone efflux protein
MTIFDNYAAYCAAIFFATIIPGPSMMVAFAHGVRYGVSRTVFTALGNMIASLLQALAALFAILKADALWTGAFVYLRLLGGFYLVYLGCRLIPSTAVLGMEDEDAASLGASPLSMFWQGFAVAIFNPKAILFFSSLFPQFVQSERQVGALLSSVLPPICVISVAGFLIYARLGTQISRMLSHCRIGRYLNTGIGILFIVLGATGLWSAKREMHASPVARDAQSAIHQPAGKSRE